MRNHELLILFRSFSLIFLSLSIIFVLAINTKVCYCIVYSFLFNLLEFETSWSQIQAWSSPHVVFKYSLSPCMSATLFIATRLLNFIFPFFGQYTTPKIIPKLLRYLPICYLYIVKIMKWNCLMIKPGHTLFKFFAKCLRAY